MPTRIHHTAIAVSDLETSIRFYRDGLGFSVVMDDSWEGPWRGLLNAPVDHVHAVLLGDPDNMDAGTLELVEWHGAPAQPPITDGPVRSGLWLISLYLDVDAVLARLTELGFHDHQRVIHKTPQGDLILGSARDPDGVWIELLDEAVGREITG